MSNLDTTWAKAGTSPDDRRGACLICTLRILSNTAILSTGPIHQQDPGGEADERRRHHNITSFSVSSGSPVDQKLDIARCAQLGHMVEKSSTRHRQGGLVN